MKDISSITQKTRLKIWRAVRRRMKVAIVEESKLLGSSRETGLCTALRNELRKISEYYRYKETICTSSVFPEMMEFKPKQHANEFSYWWSIHGDEGYKERIKVCNAIVRRLEINQLLVVIL